MMLGSHAHPARMLMRVGRQSKMLDHSLLEPTTGCLSGHKARP